MQVKTLKAKFKQEYNLTLRVYQGKVFAEDGATLASIATKKVDDFKAASNMLVGNFEKRFEESTGLKVQIATPDDSSLVNNASPLSVGKNWGK